MQWFLMGFVVFALAVGLFNLALGIKANQIAEMQKLDRGE